MNAEYTKKKAQSLPLNTIVIAILVIIVLLVIIVFFTSKLGQGGEQIDETQSGFRSCQVGTTLIPGDKYIDAQAVAKNSCNGNDKQVIIGADTGDEALPVCCGTLKQASN